MEQFEGVTVRHGRRTPLLRAMLAGIAVALAGRAGARLAAAAACVGEPVHAVATRFDKLAVRYLATLHIAAINLWLSNS